MSHHSEALRDLGERLQQEGAANHLVQGLLQAGLESQDFAEWHILEQMIGQMGQISGDCEALEQYFTTGFLPIDLVSQAPALSVDSKSRNALVAGQSHLTGGDSRGGVADFPLLTPSPSLRRVWVQPVDVPSSVGQKAGPTVSPSTGSAPVAHPAADSRPSEAAARGGWSALAQAVAKGEFTDSGLTPADTVTPVDRPSFPDGSAPEGDDLTPPSPWGNGPLAAPAPPLPTGAITPAGPTVSPSTGFAPVAHPAADSMGSEAAARGGWSALAQAVAGGESGVMLSSLTNGLDTLPPPVPNPQPPAWDLDEIMDAISQEIDREYRYFYGD